MVTNEEMRQAFAERLKKALKSAGHPLRGAPVRMHEITGKSPNAASKWLKGESFPGPSNLKSLCDWLNVREEWLAFGKGQMHLDGQSEPKGMYLVDDGIAEHNPSDGEYALIPQLSARAENGNGFLNENVEVKGGLAFKRAWIARHHLKPDSLSVIYARGESMEPSIFEGDVVLIDHAAKEPRNGKVFALRRPDDSISIKRLLLRMSGEWVLSSDNPNKALFPEEVIDAQSVAHVPIIGQVVWRGGALT